ncbi:hypothetical protein [Nostoc commune]|uniref:hypothetical protein n=1 Tax=Nostoc commune TaxID=1178 RepID=UPI0018C4637E|nr:hypothetical protein [Nostoc commune]
MIRAKILAVISVCRSISHCPSQSIPPKMTEAIAYATFTLATPLLIRSGQSSIDKSPDVVHLYKGSTIGLGCMIDKVIRF